MKFNTTFEYVNYTLISLWNNIQQIEDNGLRDILMADYNDLEDGINTIEKSVRDSGYLSTDTELSKDN